MEWPPQNTGLFAAPECIMCAPPPPCVREWVDSPFNHGGYAITKDYYETTAVVTPSAGVGYQRLSIDIPDMMLISRQYIYSGLTLDPGDCGAVAQILLSMRARIVSATGVFGQLNFFPLIKQDGVFYIDDLSTTHWAFGVAASFATRNRNVLPSHPWTRWDPATASGVTAAPDFTVTGSPLQFGFRLISFTNTSEALANITFDVELFNGTIF